MRHCRIYEILNPVFAPCQNSLFPVHSEIHLENWLQDSAVGICGQGDSQSAFL